MTDDRGSFDDDEVVANLSEHLDDVEKLREILAPVLNWYARLAPKAAWAANVVAQDLNRHPPGDEFGPAWLLSWSRYYVQAARAARGDGRDFQLNEQPTLYLTWHHPSFPLLLRPFGAGNGLILLAQDCEWMREAAGAGECCCFREKGSHAQIRDAFASGRHVAAMIDYCYDETSAVTAPFLGRASRTPAGALALASRHGFRVEVVSWSGSQPRSILAVPAADQPPEWLAAAVNRAVSEAILEDPPAWLLWPSLDRRWTTPE